MSAQQFPRPGVPSGLGQALMSGASTTVIPGNHSSTAGAEEINRDADHGPQDHPSSTGGPLPFRDDKQETVVVRPYPQVQVHGQPLTLPQHLSVQPGAPVTVSAPPAHLPQGLPLTFPEGAMKGALKAAMPSRLIAPAPASDQGHLVAPPKVPGQVAISMDSSMPPTSAIPVATISGQQGHSSNFHHLMAANVQIIRSSAPALQITSSAAPPHTFTSHLPRGAAAAAVMSSTKGPTVLRPATGPSAGGQPGVQHIIHQPIQSRPAVTTSTTVPTVVAPITATRPQSPVITTAVSHSAEVAHGRPGLSIHPQSGAISIQRPPPSRDTATRISLPSHPAIGVQKTQPPHTMAQKPIFSTVTPVAAATVAPIQATNTAPSTTATGSSPHTQMTTSNIVTMTMPPHSSHATGVNTSTIPVAKVVPQPIAHTSPRIHADYPGERGSLLPISAHRSSPNPVTVEARSDNRQSVPMQFQYILPTYPSTPYPLTHTYTPITSSVSGIRQYPVTPQAPSSAMPAQAGVGVASAVHLNPMQLMTVDRLGLQSTQITAQAMQPAAIGPQGITPAAVGAQGLHSSAPIVTQQAPIGSQQPPQTEPKASVVLADATALVTSPLGGAFGGTQPVTTAAQSHPQGSGTAPAPVSSPRPSILRKKPANEGSAVRKSLIPFQTSDVIGCRTDNSALRSASGSPRPASVKVTADVHVTVAPPVIGPVEAPPCQPSEVQGVATTAQHLAPANPALPPMATPPSQPAATLSAVPAMTATPPVPASAQPTPPVAIGTAASTVSSVQPEPKVKQEVEPMDTSQPVPPIAPCATPALGPPGGPLSASVGDCVLGASPRKKPRKQQHVISTEESEVVEAHSTDEERACARPLGFGHDKRKTPPKEYIDEEGVRYVPARSRPPMTLLRHYRNPWKAAYHHFQRYGDIKVKEGKKGTLQDMASQKGVACRVQGYKIRLCAAQLRQLMSLEHDVYSRLTTLQEGLIPKKRAADDDLHRINELIQGNMQRCKLVMDQVTEAREAMMKVLDHKDRVMRLLGENGTKKSSKLKHKERA